MGVNYETEDLRRMLSDVNTRKPDRMVVSARVYHSILYYNHGLNIRQRWPEPAPFAGVPLKIEAMEGYKLQRKCQCLLPNSPVSDDPPLFDGRGVCTVCRGSGYLDMPDAPRDGTTEQHDDAPGASTP